MKKLLAIALAAAAWVALPCAAQTAASTASVTPPSQFFTNAPAAVQPFINTLANWVTSYNTNLTWGNGFALDTGIATTTGQQIADRLELIDNLGNFEVIVAGEFTGVGSAFNEVEAGFGYALVNKYDFKLCAELTGGYDFNKSDKTGKRVGAMVINPELAAYKMITANTFATIKYGFPVESVGKFNAVGVFYVGAGFTF